MLEAIHKIGGVKEIEGNGAERVTFFGLFQSRTDQLGARHLGADDGIAAALQPGAQLVYLRGTAYAIRSLDNHKTARQQFFLLSEMNGIDAIKFEFRHTLVLIF